MTYKLKEIKDPLNEIDFLESSEAQTAGGSMGTHYALIGIGVELRSIAFSLEKLIKMLEQQPAVRTCTCGVGNGDPDLANHDLYCRLRWTSE